MTRREYIESHRPEIKKFSKKLEKLYVKYKWTWCKEIPTTERIYNYILDAIDEVELKKIYSISSGGITVSKDECGVLNVKWALEENLWI